MIQGFLSFRLLALLVFLLLLHEILAEGDRRDIATLFAQQISNFAFRVSHGRGITSCAIAIFQNSNSPLFFLRTEGEEKAAC